LFFDCDKETAAQRFESRQLPGRLDDDVEMFERRHAEYAVLNRKVMEHYIALGKLVEVRLGVLS
jgi:adenylate kinase family enzyme